MLSAVVAEVVVIDANVVVDATVVVDDSTDVVEATVVVTDETPAALVVVTGQSGTLLAPPPFAFEEWANAAAAGTSATTAAMRNTIRAVAVRMKSPGRADQ